MGSTRIDGIQIRGVASAVPAATRTVQDEVPTFGTESAQKVAQVTGVHTRHVVEGNTCTSDLCLRAADDLLTALGWDRASVDGVILVTQTPDYVLPATACGLQHRLGLSKNCAAFDINLGCSGYVYGIWIAGSLLVAGGARRILLLTGDTASRTVSTEDRSTALLFGDAGTATALEAGTGSPIFFDFGTDGAGRDHLIIPAGGYRQPRSPETSMRSLREDGNVRSDDDVYMNGAEIFAFTLREVPRSVKNVMESSGWTVDQVDAFVLHQANQFMLEHVAKRMKVPKEKLILALDDFGNTSSASIPLAMTSRLRDRLHRGPVNLLLSGFGVGLSWASAAVTMGPMTMPELAVIG
jgi:3-oxoacyl-[acyl-carrier-protein] synthase III